MVVWLISGADSGKRPTGFSIRCAPSWIANAKAVNRQSHRDGRKVKDLLVEETKMKALLVDETRAKGLPDGKRVKDLEEGRRCRRRQDHH